MQLWISKANVCFIFSSSDDSLTVRSSGFISNPASPDSPSLCDVSNSTLLTEEESNKNKETQECDCKDLSASSVSLDSIEKCSLHSDSKVSILWFFFKFNVQVFLKIPSQKSNLLVGHAECISKNGS